MAKKSKQTKAASSSSAATAKTTTAQAEQRELVKKRQEERRKQYESNQRTLKWMKIGSVVVGVLLLAAAFYWIYDQVESSSENQMPENVVSYSYTGGDHDDSFTDWTESPPVGGFHANTWQNCAYYPAAIPSGQAVHSLEHGAVWITYRPELPQEQRDKLKDLADGDGYILVSEYSDQDSPIVMTAWNKQLDVADADSEDIQRFLNNFKQSASNAPEPGALCSNGSSATSA